MEDKTMETIESQHGGRLGFTLPHLVPVQPVPQSFLARPSPAAPDAASVSFLPSSTPAPCTRSALPGLHPLVMHMLDTLPGLFCTCSPLGQFPRTAAPTDLLQPRAGSPPPKRPPTALVWALVWSTLFLTSRCQPLPHSSSLSLALLTPVTHWSCVVQLEDSQGQRCPSPG